MRRRCIPVEFTRFLTSQRTHLTKSQPRAKEFALIGHCLEYGRDFNVARCDMILLNEKKCFFKDGSEIDFVIPCYQEETVILGQNYGNMQPTDWLFVCMPAHVRSFEGFSNLFKCPRAQWMLVSGCAIYRLRLPNLSGIPMLILILKVPTL